MGFYYGPSSRPPSRWRRMLQRIGRYVPQPIHNWWADVAEVAAITQIVMGIILPVLAMMMVFVLVCVGLMFLVTLLGGSR